jgi:hypothetical protein
VDEHNGAPYGHAGDLEAGTEAFRDAWVTFKAAAGPEALARAIETQDNARSKRRGKRALN